MLVGLQAHSSKNLLHSMDLQGSSATAWQLGPADPKHRDYYCFWNNKYNQTARIWLISNFLLLFIFIAVKHYTFFDLKNSIKLQVTPFALFVWQFCFNVRWNRGMAGVQETIGKAQGWHHWALVHIYWAVSLGTCSVTSFAACVCSLSVFLWHQNCAVNCWVCSGEERDQ